MDLALYLRVIWRFRILVAAGFVLAVLLAVWSTARVSFAHGRPHLSYRKAETFEADTVLLVTERGISWGGTNLPTTPGSPAGSVTPPNPSSLSGLATFWAQLVSSDPVQSLIDRQLPASERGAVVVQAATSLPDPSTYNGVLPFIAVQGVATSASSAIHASLVGAQVFIRYVAAQQAHAGILPKDRVLLALVQSPTQAKLVVPRKKTVPIAVFLTVMIATFGAAFVLENLRPRPVRSAWNESTDGASVSARRVA